MRTCTIHQPNFLPWYPFFKKMEEADVFVFLTNCQYEKNGYQNRFMLGDEWHTLSVNHGLDPIIKKKYTSPFEDWARICTDLKQYTNILTQFDEYVSECLAWTNMGIAMHIANMLGIKAKRRVDRKTDLRGTDRLVDICLENDCDCYISGPSGSKYLEIEKFKSAGIEVQFFNAREKDKRPILEVL